MQIKLTKYCGTDKISMLVGGKKMIFYPKLYVDNIKEISYEMIEKNQIHAIILDMDNTLIDFEANLLKRSKTVV